jgi:multicomponent K+:H+ antiporter subunit A
MMSQECGFGGGYYSMSEGLLLVIMTFLPFAGGLLAAFLPKHARNTAAGLAWGVAAIGIICALLLFPAVSEGVVRHEIEWVPSFGANLILRLDGLSWIFSVLVLLIGALVVLYARYYMSAQDPVPRFFSYFLAFMGAMLGIVMSGNLIQLVVFWELTSLFSFLLIGYWHHNVNAREGARMALTVTATGGLCLLIGVILLGYIVGSFDLDVVMQAGEQIRGHILYETMLVLVLIGALSKSAQFPFHFWLPHAMAAPTPVSAYLHSATMVKAGIFLLIRLWPVMAGTDTWLLLVGGAGVITLLLGSYVAIFQHDLKGLLAYSTISHLGLITLLLGMGSPLAAVAAIFHTLNHATFKASLFMAAGIIDHETGTRDMRKLSGLWHFMPITATLAMVAAAAMAGVPLLNGFLSKEMFLAEILAHESKTAWGHYLLPICATLASTFAVIYSLRFIHQSFFGPVPTVMPNCDPHEPPHWMRFPIELLVLICLMVGIMPAITIGPFLEMAVHAVLGDRTPAYSLAIWHGFNPALGMSLIALVGGSIAYILFKDRLNNNESGTPPVIGQLRGRQIFDWTMALITRIAQWLEARLSTRRLQVQLRLVTAVTLLAGALAALNGTGHILPDADIWEFSSVDPAFLLLWMVGSACAIAAAYQAKYHRLSALILAGVAGLAGCITFVWLSAPDLAVTQLVVEIVTTVLLLLGLRWLPTKKEPPAGAVRPWDDRVRSWLDSSLALLAGVGMAMLSYAIMARPLPETISHFFLEHAYSEAGGRNVVNVLLVDFRGFDTLGEITVLGIVGLTVYALLRRFRPAADSLQRPEQQRAQRDFEDAHSERGIGSTLIDYLLVPRVIIQWLFPVVIVFAIYLLLRGHDLPGGGFAGGVALSIAFLLQYLAADVRWVEARLTIRPIYWIGIGLLLATLTGIAPLLLGYPFLTSYFEYVEFPVLGKLPLASALLFDIGILILVVGATILTLIALAHQSIRTPRVVKVEVEGEQVEDMDAEHAPEPVQEPEAEDAPTNASPAIAGAEQGNA